MPLSKIQLRTATIILALPEAAGFALAGGAALVIHEIVDRVLRISIASVPPPTP
jgi:hypothetical protein